MASVIDILDFPIIGIRIWIFWLILGSLIWSDVW